MRLPGRAASDCCSSAPNVPPVTSSAEPQTNSQLAARLADPSFWATDPHPHLTLLRAQAPLALCEEPGVPRFWAVSKHADLLRISRDPATFCSSKGVLLMDQVRDLPHIPGALLYIDPPDHVRYRRLLNPAFSTSKMRALEADTRTRARALIDAIPTGEPIDIVANLTVPFPLLVIADLLGVPGEDWPRFYKWSDIMIGAATEITDESITMLAEMGNYFLDLVAQRRVDPRDDLVTMLCHADVDGHTLTDEELMMFYGQLLVAGNETTRNLLSGGLIALAEHPDQWQLLRDDPARIPVAVEELLRWTTPVISFMRTATCDVTVSDTQISEGDPLLLLYTSANRDEDAFGTTANQLDVTRETNNQVAFGFGEHFCLGAALARIEARVFFEEVTARFSTIALAGEPQRLASGVIAGITSAPLLFSP